MRHGMLPADAARRRADPARRLGGGRGAAADRGRSSCRGDRPRRAGVSSASGSAARTRTSSWRSAPEPERGGARAGRTAPLVVGGVREVRRARCAAQAARLLRLRRATSPHDDAGRRRARCWRDARGSSTARWSWPRTGTSCWPGWRRWPRASRTRRSRAARRRRGAAGVRLPRPGLAVGRAWRSSCWTSNEVFRERMAPL